MRSLIDRITDLFAAPSTAPAPPPARAPTLAADDPRVPDTARPTVARLLATVAEVEGRAASDPLLAGAVTELHLLRDQHLPRLIESYAAIPPSHRAEIFRRTGRSASYNLGQALDLLVAKADAVAAAVARDDIDGFTDTLRFIDERYGRGDPLG